MKRIISILLVLCVFLCACDSASSNPKDITLTLDNYEKYLNVDTSCYQGGEGFLFMYPVSDYTGPWGTEILGIVSVKGASSNFNYNDVVVVVEFSGTYDDYHCYENALNSRDNTFRMTVTVETDIAGNGENSGAFSLEDLLVTRNELIDSTCKIVSISGTITPA